MEVQALTGATGTEFEALSNQAKELGKTTMFSATQSANAMSELASAGFTTTEIMSAMPGLLDLAASGNIGLAEAANIASSTLRGFGLEASQSSHVSDVLAEAAARTNAGVTDMGMAMGYIAPVASAMGVSIEETAAAVGLLSNAGIQGSKAGTVLRSALSSLAKPSKEASELMANLGFNAYDANGKMIPLNKVIANLQKSMSGLTDEQKQNALVTIFGQEALSGMLALIAAGPDELNNLTNGFENCDGAAKGMADTMQNNLQGKVTQFKSALEGAGIAIGEILIPALTKIVVKATDILSSFNNLDEGTQKVILTFGLIAAAIGPVLTIAGKLTMGVGGIVKGFSLLSSGVSTAISAMGGFGSVISLLTGPIGIITAVIVAAVAAWKTNFAGFRDACESIFEDLGRIFDAIKEKISVLWANIKNAWDTDLGGMQTILTTAWENFTTICGAAFQAIADLFDLFADAFEGNWQGVWDNVFNIFNGIFDGLQIAFSNSLNTLITILDGWFPGLEEKLGSLTDIFNNTWNFVQEACNIGIENVRLSFEALGMILEGDFQGALDLFKGRWGEAWEAIKTNVSDAKEAIITKVGELKENFITKVAELKEEAEQKFTEIKEAITTKVSEAVEKVSEFFAQLPENIAHFLGNALETIIGWGTEMYNTLTTKVKAAIESVSQCFSQLPGKIQTFLSNALSNIKTWASNIATSAAQAGKQFVSNVSNAISQLPGRIKSSLNSALSAISSFAASAASKALSAGRDICNKVVSGIKSLPSAVARIGAQVPSAIYNAIVSAGANLGGQIASWVKGKISSAIQGAKSAMANFAFATGTENAPEGLAEVAEYGPELIVSRSGAGAYLATDRQLINLEGGERIYNARQTSEILNGMQNYSSNDDSDLLRTLILKVDTTNKILQEKEFNKITENMIQQVDVNGVTDIKDITDQITRYIDKRTI